MIGYALILTVLTTIVAIGESFTSTIASVMRLRRANRIGAHVALKRGALFSSENGRTTSEDDSAHDEGEDEDDEIIVKPYGNRSLAWTKRYRRLNPYEKCRQRVLQFGHRSKSDWDDAVASGMIGAYVPARPDEMYAPEWVSWEEFLGLMRSYEDARNLAVNVLGLKSWDDYILFVRSNPKRAEGLRIPLRPDMVYKEEWIDEETFFRKQ